MLEIAIFTLAFISQETPTVCDSKVKALAIYNRPVFKVGDWPPFDGTENIDYKSLGKNVLNRGLPRPISVAFKNTSSVKIHLRKTPDGAEVSFETIEGDQNISRIPQTATNLEILAAESPLAANLALRILEKAAPTLKRFREVKRDQLTDEVISLVQGEALASAAVASHYIQIGKPSFNIENLNSGNKISLGSIPIDHMPLVRLKAEMDSDFHRQSETYSGRLKFIVMHTHPGSGAPLNEKDALGALQNFKFARRLFPKAIIEVVMGAVSNEDEGRLIYLLSITHDSLPFTIESSDESK